MIIASLLSVSILSAPSAAFGISATKTIVGPKAVAVAAPASGGRFAAAMEDRTVRILDAATRQTIRTLTGNVEPAYALAFSRDGKYVAAGDESARIFVFDAATGKQIWMTRKHQRGIQALAFSADSKYLVSTGKDDAVKIWELKNAKELKTILGKGANLFSAQFAPDRDVVLTGTLRTDVKIYDLSGKELASYDVPGDQGTFDLSANINGTRIVSGGKDGIAYLWDTKAAKRLGTFRGHQDWILHTAFAPSGQFVATASSDMTAKVFDVNTFKQVAELQDRSSIGSPLAFTGDGKYLISLNRMDEIEISTLEPGQAPPAATKAKTTKKKGK